MHEILFRGKRIDNGEWVKGMPCATEKSGIYALQTLQGGIFDIIPETVGQYTGLTDKNGKRIFEGDIVADNPDGEILSIFEVAWFDPIAGFMLDDGLGAVGTHEWLENRESDKMLLEVIGNIHDNPELLEV